MECYKVVFVREIHSVFILNKKHVFFRVQIIRFITNSVILTSFSLQQNNFKYLS